MVILHTGTIRFAVNIFDMSGEFQICEADAVVVRGKIRQPEDVSKEFLALSPPDQPVQKLLDLSGPDVYKELGLRGYDYSGIFRGIKSSDNYGECISQSIGMKKKTQKIHKKLNFVNF